MRLCSRPHNSFGSMVTQTQVSVIELITITVIARKLILLDYESASLETMLGLGGLALALGALYWLLAGVEQRRQSGAPTLR